MVLLVLGWLLVHPRGAGDTDCSAAAGIRNVCTCGSRRERGGTAEKKDADRERHTYRYTENREERDDIFVVFEESVFRIAYYLDVY